MDKVTVIVNDNKILLKKVDGITYKSKIFFENNIISVVFEEKRYINEDNFYMNVKDKVLFDYNYDLNLLTTEQVYRFENYLNQIACKLNYELEESKTMFIKKEIR